MDEAEGPWSRIRRGLARLVARIADRISTALGEGRSAGREEITGAELRDLIAANTVLRYEERALIGDVIAAAQRQVREVIVPRTGVVFLDAGLTVSRALRQVSDEVHSRYPVIDGSSDEVIGVVQMRDLVAPPTRDRTLTVGALATDIERIPASKPLIAALAEMRREGWRIALVVDEYGGTAGIVTLEGLVEGLVGEVRPGTARDLVASTVDGRLNLASLAERTGLVLADGPYETVAGYLMAALGKIPRTGERVEVDGWRLTVTRMDGRRVAAVTVVPPPPSGGPVPRPDQAPRAGRWSDPGQVPRPGLVPTRDEVFAPDRANLPDQVPRAGRVARIGAPRRSGVGAVVSPVSPKADPGAATPESVQVAEPESAPEDTLQRVHPTGG